MKKQILKRYIALIITIITIISMLAVYTKSYATLNDETITISFTDSYMYNKICEELKNKIIKNKKKYIK